MAIPIYEEKTMGKDFWESVGEILKFVIGMGVVGLLPFVFFVFGL